MGATILFLQIIIVHQGLFFANEAKYRRFSKVRQTALKELTKTAMYKMAPKKRSQKLVQFLGSINCFICIYYFLILYSFRFLNLIKFYCTINFLVISFASGVVIFTKYIPAAKFCASGTSIIL
jgi:hypothetical protein